MYQSKVKNEREGSPQQTMPKMCSYLFFLSFLPVHTKTLKVLHVFVNVRACV